MTADLGWEALFDLDGNVTVRALQPLTTTDGPSSGGHEPAAARVIGDARAAAGASAAARWSDPSTSHLNGHTETKVRSLAWVLGCLSRQRSPITDEHLHALAVAEGCEWSEARTRSARAELVRDGKAVCADREGRTRTGRPAQRWQTTTEAS